MSPAKLTARRLLGGGALFAALGALGLVSALPAAADQLVWGNAQAWVSSSDAVAGYSTATGFGGRTESSATSEDRYGPLADYLEVDGESHTVVDGAGARSASLVRSATFRMDVSDLAAHGIIEVPPEAEAASPSPSPEEPEETSEEEVAEREPGSLREEPSPAGREPLQADEQPSGDSDPEESPSAEAPGDVPLREPNLPLPTANDEVFTLDESTSGLVAADANAVEFTLADVTSTASAGYAGETGATFAHGGLSAFGVDLGPLRPGGDGVVVRDLLEVFDAEGDVVSEVPVSVTFAVGENTFGDQDPDWEGQGVRSWLSVRVQIGETDFSMGFADSWALASTYASTASPVPGDKGEGSPEEASGWNGRLATTGGSLAALVTAALVAVGGGSAATFLARKRTTALDDQIGDC
ncbi:MULTISPECIES: hypothetical protein [unclassified Nocardiopsis]|uniref:hypothetical protein n=1 Tax=unclassified Nocardiopsis TaxID=2649073 RepID=UPI001F4929AC|nr:MULTISPECIES: hypothetical protein [unclassified Nocardiopsis]